LTPRPLDPKALALAAALFTALVLPLPLACSAARYSAEPGAPTLILPARFGEGTGGPGGSAAPSASAAPAPSANSPAAPPYTISKLPDPTPLRTAQVVEYQLELSEGKVKVVSVKPVTLKEPAVTARQMGRWALELSIGQELIERVRFDFPQTAADEPQADQKRLRPPLDLGSRAIARVTVRVPHSARVRRAVLFDRAHETVMELEWPLPAPPPPAPASSASASPAASGAPPKAAPSAASPAAQP
jgi:hypothetical protein